MREKPSPVVSRLIPYFSRHIALGYAKKRVKKLVYAIWRTESLMFKMQKHFLSIPGGMQYDQKIHSDTVTIIPGFLRKFPTFSGKNVPICAFLGSIRYQSHRSCTATQVMNATGNSFAGKDRYSFWKTSIFLMPELMEDSSFTSIHI